MTAQLLTVLLHSKHIITNEKNKKKEEKKKKKRPGTSLAFPKTTMKHYHLKRLLEGKEMCV